MKCYECGIDAVLVCRWCAVGLCREHLATSLEDRKTTMACTDVMPEQAAPRQ